MRFRGRRSVAVVGVALMLTGCGTIGDFFAEPAVFDSGIDPIVLELEGPAYTAAVKGGLLLRSGDATVVLDGPHSAAWLPGGRFLVSERHRVSVVDPATGPVGRPVRVRWEAWAGPAAITALRGNRLSTYDLELGLVDTVRLPAIDVPDLVRGYYGAVATVGDATFVQWDDYNPDGEDTPDGPGGLLRIVDDEMTEVLVGDRIVDLRPTPDGAALLAVRQVSGEPCGGCIVPQEIVEIDPSTGEIVGEYGMPEGYDDSWRVQEVDKIGDRVAVRFYESRRTDGYPQEIATGTWVFDGSWERLEGSESVTTWWQGDGRIEARPAPDEPGRLDGFQLVWVSGDDETELPGELIWARGRRTAWGSVAGRLLPPE